MELMNEQVVWLPIGELTTFPGHPFKVCDDDGMKQLMESIRAVGVLSPVIVRRAEENEWQIVSGHRRIYACKQLELESIPAIIKKIDMDEAIIMMVDSNFQRKEILPSEKAKAYRMKMDAVKRQGARRDLTSDHDEQKLRGKSTRDLIAENSPDSSTQIQRFVRLNELVPELLDFVDAGRVGVTPAVELSYLREEEQLMVLMTIESEQSSPSRSQALRMRRMSENGTLDEDVILAILSEQKKVDCWNLSLPMNRISKYFPATYTYQQMQDTIIKLLEGWLERRKKLAEKRGGIS